MDQRNCLDKAAEDALIARAAAHDDAATSQLYTFYQGLLHKEAHQRYLAAAGLQDETEGIAALAFIEAIHSYDAARGVHFAAFLQRRVKDALYMAFCRLRRYLARTSHPDQDRTADGDFWDLLISPARDARDPAATCPQRLLLRQAIQRLTAKEKQLLGLIYLYELPQKTIAAQLHVSHQYISKTRKHLLSKMRQSIDNCSLSVSARLQ
ncbi:RNA polymerase sigma factor, sigma-70 family [Selenomonas sp. GACV-9]|uniref:sigma-70 family RNA polymerase sigma factor n=1 Tax=Selenomonas sp. GACV-9 TaxID=3158782 RepID=UPI0008E6D347|nr:RNA polymerase sigma factor, sigma-70 family [Selenomonas ruminantium]